MAKMAKMAKMQADSYLEQVSRQALEDPTRLSVRKIPAAVARRYSMASLGPLFSRPSTNALLPNSARKPFSKGVDAASANAMA